MDPTLKPYPHYKPSGVEWLGDVPAHWEMRRTKSLLKERSQKGFPNEPLLAATQTKGVVRKEHYENRTVLALRDLHLLKLVYPGDFVISLRSFQGGIEYAHDRGIISPAYTILYPENPDIHGYLAWLFKSKPYIENLTLHVTGIRQGQNIDYGRLCVSKIPLPPHLEQTAIVRYLNQADERIRRYISSRERLIKLLEEYRQAVIHHAVTRGLDPDVRLKPSGVTGLGDMPTHWEAKRLKTIGRIRYGLGQPPRESADGLPLIRATNVDHGRIIDKNLLYIDPLDVPSGRDAILREKEIIVVRSGAYTGDSAIVPKAYDGAVTGYDMVLSVTGAQPEFVAMALLCKYVRDDQLIVASTRSAQPHLNAEELGTAILLVPPLHEQTAIVAYLDKATGDIDAAIDRARREIELLGEYRTRLIADVVTGKVDVREAVADLPDDGDVSALDF